MYFQRYCSYYSYLSSSCVFSISAKQRGAVCFIAQQGVGIELQSGCLAKTSKLWECFFISRYRWSVSIRVYCETFLVLARLCKFPTPVFCRLPSASRPSPLFSSLYPVTPPPFLSPFSLPVWPFCCAVGFGEGESVGGISRLLDFFFFGGESYSEDGARCYGVSAEIQSVMLLKKFFSCSKLLPICSIFEWQFSKHTPHSAPLCLGFGLIMQKYSSQYPLLSLPFVELSYDINAVYNSFGNVCQSTVFLYGLTTSFVSFILVWIYSNNVKYLETLHCIIVTLLSWASVGL